MNWEGRSPKNLFGWQKPHRAAALTILRTWPELHLGNLAPRIWELNGGCRGPWYVATERKA